ncbi:MAG: trypsin-like peptidase domain-containing protein [Acidobacteriota bacterium]|nr:trypsin-like peptidase domain-containing protein [Acidobacteriota bacterium]
MAVPAALQAGPAAVPEGLSASERRDIEVFRAASPSVVNVTSLVAVRRDFFSLDVTEMPQGSGSGFIWDRDGHVVTNFHVLEGGRRWTVTLGDHSTHEAVLVGVAPDKDLAVLRIEAPAETLSPLPLGRSRDLVVGQRVLAIGNPFGLDQSLTVGVVSALGRELTSPSGRTIRDVVQTDAAINPGNSGGPLLDSAGRLIGVNSAIYSPSGASAGIGFAVPVDTVARLVPELIEYGRPIRPGIGVTLLPDSLTRRIDVEGVAIQSVERGGPADRAGLEGIRSDRSGRRYLGDVIAAVNGEKVGDFDELATAFERAGIGAVVELVVLRDGEARTVGVEVVALEN